MVHIWSVASFSNLATCMENHDRLYKHNEHEKNLKQIFLNSFLCRNYSTKFLIFLSSENYFDAHFFA